MAVESHNLDQGGDQVIDLNKTSMKKPRRRTYQPKSKKNLHQNNLDQLDKKIRDIFGEDLQSCASPHCYQGICDTNNFFTATKHLNGRNLTTPDLRWRINSNMAFGYSPIGTYQSPFSQHNVFPEQDAAASMVNLQNVHEEVVANTVGSSPGKASMAVENLKPDQGGDQFIDLNKTPQKKPRRGRYQPKVVSEKNNLVKLGEN